MLATVVAGIRLGRRSAVIYSPETRLVGENVWSLWIYVINAFVFLAIGLQLRTFVQDGARALALLPAALAISVLLIVVRMLWVYVAAWVPRALSPRLRARDPMPSPAALLMIGWTGMRGIVSLAAALALPFTAQGGSAFPARDAIVFITFVVIFVTLVGQGLTLIPLVKKLGLGRDGEGDAREVEVRVAALEAGLREIDAMRARCRATRSAPWSTACATSTRTASITCARTTRRATTTRRPRAASTTRHRTRRCAPSARRSCSCATAARSPTRSSAACNTTSTSPKRGCFERKFRATQAPARAWKRC